MPSLSREELTKLVTAAGFKGEEVPIAVAIVFAESGGNPKAHNATPPDDSYGLFQINMLGGLGPDRRKKYNLPNNEALYDPATNARVAYGIYKGSGWKAWTTYTRGTYKKHMDDQGGTGTVADAPAATGAGSNPNPVLGVGDAINAFGSTLFKGFANIAGIAVAIALLIIGVVLLGRNAIPVGKAVKLAKKVAE